MSKLRHCHCCLNVYSQKYRKKLLIHRPIHEVNGKQKSIDVMEIPNFSAYHNFEFEPRGIRVSKAYSVGEGKTANYTNIVHKPQGPNSIVVRWSNFFFGYF